VPVIAELTTWAASGALSWYGATLGVIREAASNDPPRGVAVASTVAVAVHSACTVLLGCKAIKFKLQYQNARKLQIENRAKRLARRARDHDHPCGTRPKVVVAAGLAVLAAVLIPISEVRRRFSYLDSPHWNPEKPYPREYLTTLIRPLRDTQHQSAEGIGNYLFYGKRFEAVQATADSALAGFVAHPSIKPFISDSSSAGINLECGWSVVGEVGNVRRLRQLDINLKEIWELGTGCQDKFSNEDSQKILANKAASGFLKLVVHTNSFEAFQNRIFLNGFKEGNATAVSIEEVRAALFQLLSLDSFKEVDLNAISCPDLNPSRSAAGMVNLAEGTAYYYASDDANYIFNNKTGTLTEALDPLLDNPGIEVIYKAVLGDETLEDTQEANRRVIENMPEIYVRDYNSPSTPESEPSPESTDGPVNASQEPEPSPERTDPPKQPKEALI
jgi:hypothetical protein